MNRLGNVRVLIVEDHFNMRRLWRSILFGFGIRDVYDAANALDAIEILKLSPVDVMIVDYHLEDLNGAEFVNMVRKGSDSPAPHVPAIACSSDTRRSVIKDWVNAGVDEILAKPVSAEQAWQKLYMITNKRRDFVSAPRYFGPDRRRRPSPFMGAEERRVIIQHDDCFVD